MVAAEREARVFLLALLQAHGWCISTAARAAGVSAHAIYSQLYRRAPVELAIARARGLVRRGVRPGEDHPRAALTNAQVAEFRRRKAAGERAFRLAREACVTRDAMDKILRGERYPHAS